MLPFTAVLLQLSAVYRLVVQWRDPDLAMNDPTFFPLQVSGGREWFGWKPRMWLGDG